ncbi:MAG: lysophospholipid acyltransferase family protein [Planctomycetaceae bacterium]
MLSPIATALVIAVLVVAAIVVRACLCPAGWKAWVLYQITRVYCPLLFRWKAANPCTIPEEGPAIIVGNHTSPVDPVLLWMGHFRQFRRRRIRVIGYMMAGEYFRIGGPVGWVFRAMESIPATRSGRDTGAVRAALDRLQKGKLLGMFPEGRINVATPDTKLLRSGTGAAWLALKSGAPVIPVFIRNAPRGRGMVTSFLKPARTEIVYGQQIDLSPWRDSKATTDDLREVADRIMASLAELGGVEFTPLLTGTDAVSE